MKERKQLLARWRQLDVADLNLELQSLLKEQFKLKLQHSIGELKDLHKIRLVRRSVARVLAILTEKKKG